MRLSFLLLFLFIFQIAAICQSKNIILPKSGMFIENFVPKGWQLLSSASGDLNKDGIIDMAFAIQNTDTANIEIGEGDYPDTVDLNPRVLGIYFGQKDGKFKKQLQANEFIILKDIPHMEEPFDGLKILANGVLQIDFHFWMSMGSWYTSNYQYKFRFQNDQFEFIGYESNETHRGSGESTAYSINFSTRKMITTKTSFDEETDEESITQEQKSFNLKTLKSISTLAKPFEWEFEGIYL